MCKALRKRDGQAEWVLGMFFLLFLVVMLCTQLQLDMYQTSALYLDDALAASNLASAIIDLEEYGATYTICIADPLDAYRLFCDAVKSNLQLGDGWTNMDTGIIEGMVTVEDYIIYNVKGDFVTSYRVTGNGKVQKQQGRLGMVQAPNGVTIESTSVYSEIAFPVKGLFGHITEAHKGRLVDIVTNGEE